MNYTTSKSFFANPPPPKFQVGDIVEVVSEDEIKKNYTRDPLTRGDGYSYSRDELNITYFSSRFCYCEQLAQIVEVGGFDPRLTPYLIDKIISQKGKICPEREIKIRMFKKVPGEYQEFYVTEGMIRHIDEGKAIPDSDFDTLF